MKHVMFLVGLLAILYGCDEKKKISGRLDFHDALLEYTAEGSGSPLVMFTGGENVGQKLFPKELKDNFVLIHADPSKLDSTLINDISLDDILEDLEKLRVSIGVEKIGIWGHSMFGLLPFEYALKYPNNISYTISTGSKPFRNEVSKEASKAYWAKDASDERKRIRAQNWDKLENIDWNALSPTQQFVTSYTADTPFRFYDPNFDQTKFWEGVEINMAFLYHYNGTLMKNFDNSDNYRNIKSPVLILAGKYDFGSPYYLWEEFTGIIPNLTLKVYENAGHNPFMEYPETFTKDILKWVEENE
jgi:proline iminopeptidase